jgi:hypothetical protein
MSLDDAVRTPDVYVVAPVVAEGEVTSAVEGGSVDDVRPQHSCAQRRVVQISSHELRSADVQLADHSRTIDRPSVLINEAERAPGMRMPDRYWPRVEQLGRQFQMGDRDGRLRRAVPVHHPQSRTGGPHRLDIGLGRGFAAQGHHSQRGVCQPRQTAAGPEQSEVAGREAGRGDPLAGDNREEPAWEQQGFPVGDDEGDAAHERRKDGREGPVKVHGRNA